MDFKGLRQKIDMDNFKAKIPNIPPMPQLKLPSSISNFRSRNIFKTTRHDVNKDTSPKTHPGHQHQVTPIPLSPLPPAPFIERTPMRISTISSLVQQKNITTSETFSNKLDGSTYRSAESIDDDYYRSQSQSPKLQHQFNESNAHTTSAPTIPIGDNASPSTNENATMSFTEKIQKGYKAFADFKLRHIFVKKTVLRKDQIQVDYYVDGYDQERNNEQQQEIQKQQKDRPITKNSSKYRFHFKESRQMTGHSNSITSPEDSPKLQPNNNSFERHVRNMSEHSGDESGLEEIPSVSPSTKNHLRKSPVHAATGNNAPSASTAESMSSTKSPKKDPALQSKTYKQRIRRITNYWSSQEGNDVETTTNSNKVFTKFRKFAAPQNARTPSGSSKHMSSKLKRKAPLSPQESNDQLDQNASQPETSFQTIRHNLKRVHNSLRRNQKPKGNSAIENKGKEQKPQATRAKKISARIKRFTSKEEVIDSCFDENHQPSSSTNDIRTDTQNSPLRTVLNHKIKSLKKTFRKQNTDAGTKSDDEASPEKPKNSKKFIKKLKHMRPRKLNVSADNVQVDKTDNSKTVRAKSTGNLEEKFLQARQRTLKKVNEKIHQIGFFHKSQELDERTAKSTEELSTNIPPTISRRSIPDKYHNSFDHDEQGFNNIKGTYSVERTRATAAWTTEPILSDSMDSELDCDFPRVLIHQDHSNAFESTLVIAVTRPAPVPSPVTPLKITEIPVEVCSPKHMEITNHIPRPKSSNEWISNKQIISGFRQISPPGNKLSKTPDKPHTMTEVEKPLIESSSDSDSWLSPHAHKEHITLSNSTQEEAWKILPANRKPTKNLYKTKSIDIFDNGASAAFQDFDEHLQNEPVIKILNRNVDSIEIESSEDTDTADEDSASRITKIFIKPSNHEGSKQLDGKPNINVRQFGNSRESLIEQFNEHEELNSDDENRPPSKTPSPPPFGATPRPPSISPPPPPLPQRKIPDRSENISPNNTGNYIAPSLPSSKPPLTSVPQVPERNTSMNRPSKPLVKTSSLRLTYREQVNPDDIGKVNKLISQFEPPIDNSRERPIIIPRRIKHSDSDSFSDENDLPQTYSEHFEEREKTPTNPSTYEKTTTGNFEISSKTSFFNKYDSENNINAIESPTTLRFLHIDKNANCSTAGSEYSSPAEYPSSLIGSTQTTPVPDRRHTMEQRNLRRNKRSLAKDDESFHSFDSDEENSYYSISSTSSNRFVVEI